ncbi:MAG: hypothetical protein WDW38_000537 [Sanguina aurantia]
MEPEEEGDHAEEVEMFCAVTGAVAHVAEHYLSGSRRRRGATPLPRLTRPPIPSTKTWIQMLSTRKSFTGGGSGVAGAPGAPSDAQYQFQSTYTRTQHFGYMGGGGGGGGGDAEDFELQRALAMSLGAADPGTGAGSSGPGEPSSRQQQQQQQGTKQRLTGSDDDEDDEEFPGCVITELDGDGTAPNGGDGLAAMARQRQASLQASQRAAAARDGLVDPAPSRGSRRQRPSPAERSSAPQDVFSMASGSGHVSRTPAHHEEEMELPEGISRQDIEEARMMECAVLGIPYAAPADFRVGSGGRGAAEVDPHADPHVSEGRYWRREQDDAYEQSLKADMAKIEAGKRAKEQADLAAQNAATAAAEAAAAELQAEATAQRVAAEEEARLSAMIQQKSSRLGSEPEAGEAGVVSIMVRLPDGARQARRFRQSQPLEHIFDHIDVQQLQRHQEATAAAVASGGTSSGKGCIVPGSYSLVLQYPRRVIAAGQAGSLADAGITSDTALLVELNTKG